MQANLQRSCALYGLNDRQIVWSVLAVVLIATAAPTPVFAQGDPGPNTNLIGLTPDPADIRDSKARQQNEPSCAVRPGNSACIICGYNDYRTIDVFNDGWQGVSMSCDAGYTWVSRIAPGSPADSNIDARINGAFAADPRMVAIPGMAMLNFIAGYRDNNDGVVAVQHWLEVNKEDADHYEPGKYTYIVDDGTSGKFLDKPDMLAVLDPPAQQVPVTLITEMENPELGTPDNPGFIERSFPSGTLYVAYAAFTGSQSVKVLVNTSKDWGQTWTNQTLKLSEDQNLVSGVSLTAIGDTVLATWRRAGDNNDFDSIMYAFITEGGKKATKGQVLADICSFDQVSTASPLRVTFRTNDFPWAANDGKNFYVFYSDRGFGGDCATGHPRIVMNYASPNTQTFQDEPIAIDATPTDEFGEPSPESLQFMPTAFGANGKVQLAWYDTRREVGLPDDIADVLFPDQSNPAAVKDYISTNSALVQRKVDVYTTRITSTPSGEIEPIPTPVRVSQYRIAAEIRDKTATSPGKLDGLIQIEGEASFPNKKLYASGSLPFIGDYITVAAPEFRQLENGSWESNSSSVVSPSIDKTDFFVAWTDNRDVRGNIGSIEDSLPFSPSEQELPQTTQAAPDIEGDEAGSTMLAETTSDMPETGPPVDRPNTAEGLDGADLMTLQCDPFQPLDRSRDSNIYGAVIKDRVRLYAPTASKPLTGLQRAFAFVIANTEDFEREYRIEIASQPEPCVTANLCRASFRQEPSLPPFAAPPAAADLVEVITVPASSSSMRTVFVVGDSEEAQVTVRAFDTDCEANPNCATPLASIVLGGTDDMRNPEFDESIACAGLTAGECDVLRDEFHNPTLINPTLINPTLINPTLINPTLINPTLINPNLINYYLENPTLINPFLINPALINYTLANPTLINPTLINPALINPNLINESLENPTLINPNLINPNLINPTLINTTIDGNEPIDEIDDLTYTDYNFIVQNTGNVTTAYNADISLENPDNAPIDTQLIAWAPSFTTTTVDCQQRLQVEANVFTTINNPEVNDPIKIATIADPFIGELSGLAKAGETIIFTLRVYGDRDDIASLFVSGFTASSQAANCTQEVPEGEAGDWFCSDGLLETREKIVLDLLPPSLVLPPSQTIEATGPTITVPFSVTATDLSDPTPTVQCDTDSPLTFNAPFASEPVEVTCWATDSAGNTSEGSFAIKVEDTTPPTITAPADVTKEATATNTPASDVPLGSPEFFDAVGIATGSPTNNAPASYPVGDTTVTWTVEDISGLKATAEQLVTIKDTTPPEFNVTDGAKFSFEATTSAGALVDLGSAVTATDKGELIPVYCTVDGKNPPVTLPATLPAGRYDVTCTASDGSTVAISVTIIVNVQDLVPPVLTVPELPVTADADPIEGTAVVTYEVSATDAVDEDVDIECDKLSGSTFDVGPTLVTCTAWDDGPNALGERNSTEKSFKVIVSDVTAPTIGATKDPFVFSPGPDVVPPISVDFIGNIVVADAVDDDIVPVCLPPSGSFFEWGNTPVTCTATDTAGNSSSVSFDVLVDFPYDIDLIVPKGRAEAGSTVKIDWTYLRPGTTQVVESSTVSVAVFWSRYSGNNCTGEPGEVQGSDPGNSDFRYSAADNSWRFNWQTPPMPGSYVVTVSPPRTNDGSNTDSSECVTLK